MTLEQLEQELLKLPATERARLAERLISSLDEESELEKAWYDEAERRLSAIRAGAVREVPADEAYKSMDATGER
jgi:putative addiction module component (TIGR02574 family)